MFGLKVRVVYKVWGDLYEVRIYILQPFDFHVSKKSRPGESDSWIDSETRSKL